MLGEDAPGARGEQDRGGTRIPSVLSIAGSDSGGGAGIQADLKAFAACGVHGMTAVTALTAQNTVEVRAVLAVAPDMIAAQVHAVVADLGVDAVKVGMLGDAATVAAVAALLEELDPRPPIVVDPVMVSESGARLLRPDAEAVLAERVLPLATVATPNLAEARALAGTTDENVGTEELARAVRALGPAVVVLTGGHTHDATDVFFDGAKTVLIAGPRYPDGAGHGSGCTHSSALAAQLARGEAPLGAARAARDLAARAVRDGLHSLGAGPGPVDALGIRARRWRADDAHLS